MADKDKSDVSHFVYVSFLLVANTVYFGASLIVSHVTHSLTLRMDSNYVLFIVGSLIVSLIDLKLRNARSVKNTFGWARIEFLGSLFNATFLASLSFSAAVESVQQMIHLSGHSSHPHGMHEADSLKVIIFGAVRFVLGAVTFGVRYVIRDSSSGFRVAYTQTAGVEVCVTSPRLRRLTEESRTSTRSANIRSQVPPVIFPNLFVAVVRETVGPVSILACAVIVLFFGEHGWCYYVDPAICFVQIVVLGMTMFHAAKESGLALMLTIPQHLDIRQIQKDLMRKFPEVLDIHDFHLWRPSRQRIVATCHLVCSTMEDYVRISGAIDHFFNDEGIAEVTTQPEVPTSDNPELNATMAPNACACCSSSPHCCSLKESQNLQEGLRRRTITNPNADMVDLEIGSGDEGINSESEEDSTESATLNGFQKTQGVC